MPVGLAANYLISMEKQNILENITLFVIYVYFPALKWKTKIIASHFL